MSWITTKMPGISFFFIYPFSWSPHISSLNLPFSSSYSLFFTNKKKIEWKKYLSSIYTIHTLTSCCISISFFLKLKLKNKMEKIKINKIHSEKWGRGKVESGRRIENGFYCQSYDMHFDMFFFWYNPNLRKLYFSFVLKKEGKYRKYIEVFLKSSTTFDE